MASKALERRFGVEIEHGNPLGEIEVGRQLREKFPRWNNTSYDGSGVEARSPILQGQAGKDHLGEVMEFLKEIGGYVSTSDGMHVHHDAGDVANNTSAIHRVLESYMLNQPVINQFVDSRRTNKSAIKANEMAVWKETGRRDVGRHAVHFVPRYGTFEFRQFEGCLDPVKAIAWIEFGQRFIDSAVYGHKKYPVSCATSPDVLLRRIGCRQSVAKILGGRPSTTQLLPRDEARRQRALEALH